MHCRFAADPSSADPRLCHRRSISLGTNAARACHGWMRPTVCHRPHDRLLCAALLAVRLHVCAVPKQPDNASNLLAKQQQLTASACQPTAHLQRFGSSLPVASITCCSSNLSCPLPPTPHPLSPRAPLPCPLPPSGARCPAITSAPRHLLRLIFAATYGDTSEVLAAAG